MSITKEKPESIHVEKAETVSPNVEREDEDGSFKFTIGKFLAITSFQLGYMADVFSLAMVGSTILSINQDIGMYGTRLGVSSYKADSISGPSNDYTWMVNAQFVALACLCPIVGRLSDIFGRKRFLILGNALGIVGGALGATAKNVNTVIGASVLIGAASSMHQLSWSCLSEVVPKRSRGIALGLFQGSLLPASAFAPAIAYAMIQHATWRYVFWIPFILNVIGLTLVFFFYHPLNQYIKEEGKSRMDQLKQQDFVGFFLYAAGLVLFLLGLSFGGNKFLWKSAGTLAPLIVGGLLLVALGVYEATADLAYPLFPPAIFRNIRGFTVITGVIFLIGMLYYSASILWPQQVVQLYTTTPWKIGWYASSLGLGGTVFGPISGLIFRKLRHARVQFAAYVLVLTTLTGAMAIVTPESHVSSTVIVTLIGGFIGAATVVSATMIQLGVPHEYLGVATAMAVTSRAVGGAITTTIYTAILTNYVASHLGTGIATALAKAGVPLSEISSVTEALAAGDITSPALASVSPAALAAGAYAYKIVFSHAFRLVYLVSITFGILGLICAVFSADVDHLMTHRIDIKLEEGIHIRTNTTDVVERGHIIYTSDREHGA